MKILVFGGTQFLGRHIVEALKEHRLDQQLTLFNRGQSHADLFHYPLLKGDRYQDLHLLEHQAFDVVIDCSGQMPENLQQVAEKLRASSPYYLFISSCSVYDHEKDQVGEDESALLLNVDDFTQSDHNNPSMEFYGLRKLLCEQVVRQNFKRHAILRPGLIVGPHDTTFRFPYWIQRLSQGGEVLAPGSSSTPTQFIDAKDIAHWICHLIKNPSFGDFNVVGDKITFGDFFQAAKNVMETDFQITYAPEEFLQEQQVGCWMELPLWVYPAMDIFLRRSNLRAKSAGLTISALEQTIAQTWQWLKDSQNLPNNEYNLKPEKEFQLLELLSSPKS